MNCVAEGTETEVIVDYSFVTLCRSVEVDRYFGGKYCFRRQAGV
jgi:hypothetical protein